MAQKNLHSFSSVNSSSIETFHGLAAICLTSAERLTALNLASTRGMLDDLATASMQRPAKGSDLGLKLPQTAFVQPMIDNTIAYSRSAYEILVEAQQEIINTLSSQFTGANTQFRLPADWTAPFEMFTKSFQEVSTLAQQNASATAEAAKTAVEKTFSKIAKPA